MLVIKQRHPRAVDIIDKCWNDMILEAFDTWLFLYARQRAAKNGGDEQKLYIGNSFFANSEYSFK